jgi:hypothetical protein
MIAVLAGMKARVNAPRGRIVSFRLSRKYHRRPKYRPALIHRIATQIGLVTSEIWDAAMRAETIDYRQVESEQHQNVEKERLTLMTPARRAGLDALEREFTEFVKRRTP